MAGSGRMPPVDMAKEFANLKESDRHFIRKLEKMNIDRAKDSRVVRSRNKWAGLLLGTGVIGIYIYTMFSVRQENFLDFEEVPTKSKES